MSRHVLAKKDGTRGLIAYHISKPQLVDGGLTPPPSKGYPGTKCFMVTVTVDKNEYHGFGPSPSIAKTSALQKAFSSLNPLPTHDTNEMIRSLSCNGRSCHEEFPMSSEMSMTPTDHCETCVPTTCTSAAIERLFEVARQKGVKITFQLVTTFPPTEVVVAVTGGGLSFEGRNKEKSLAEQEAAEKMLKALEVFPGCSLADALRQPENHNPEKPAVEEKTTSYPYGPPAGPFLSPASLFPFPVNCHPFLPPAVNGRPPLFPPNSFPFMPYSHRGPHHLQPYPPPMDSNCNFRRPLTLSPQFTLGMPSPISQLLPIPKTFSSSAVSVTPASQLSSSGESDEESDSQETSPGLFEVIPDDRKPVLAHVDRSKQNLPDVIESVAPFDDGGYPFSDPFQFTVRLPRKQRAVKTSLPEKPPWGDIRHANLQKNNPSQATKVNQTQSSAVCTNHPTRFNQVTNQKRPFDHYPLESSSSGSISDGESSVTCFIESEAATRKGSNALPVHFLLQNEPMIDGKNKPSVLQSTTYSNETRPETIRCSPVPNFLANDVCVSLPTEGPL